MTAPPGEARPEGAAPGGARPGGARPEGAAPGPVVLGFDPGLRRTGFCALARGPGGEPAWLEGGVVAPPPALPIERRLLCIFEAARALAERLRPEAAAVEETFAGRNPGSALRLGMARAAVLAGAAAGGAPCFSHAPARIKLALGAPGGASKAEVAEMAARLVPESRGAPEDAVDALAAAVCQMRGAPLAARIAEALEARGAP